MRDRGLSAGMLPAALAQKSPLAQPTRNRDAERASRARVIWGNAAMPTPSNPRSLPAERPFCIRNASGDFCAKAAGSIPAERPLSRILAAACASIRVFRHRIAKGFMPPQTRLRSGITARPDAWRPSGLQGRRRKRLPAHAASGLAKSCRAVISPEASRRETSRKIDGLRARRTRNFVLDQQPGNCRRNSTGN
jgi:hypothetical protein